MFSCVFVIYIIFFVFFFLVVFSCFFVFAQAFSCFLFLLLGTPQELHDLWLEAAKDPVWQQIFHNCGILDELDADAIKWLDKRHKRPAKAVKLAKVEKMEKAPEEKAPDPEQNAPAFESPEKDSQLPRRVKGSRAVDWISSKEDAPTVLAQAKSRAKSSKPVSRKSQLTTWRLNLMMVKPRTFL